MYILTVEEFFSSAHQLTGYKGKCENIHGHNWKVVLSVKGEKLDATGLLVDFHDLKKLLNAILQALDHKNLNEIKPFDEMNPSSENIARYVAEKAGGELDRFGREISIESVTVWESETSRCTYTP